MLYSCAVHPRAVSTASYPQRRCAWMIRGSLAGGANLPRRKATSGCTVLCFALTKSGSRAMPIWLCVSLSEVGSLSSAFWQKDEKVESAQSTVRRLYMSRTGSISSRVFSTIEERERHCGCGRRSGEDDEVPVQAATCRNTGSLPTIMSSTSSRGTSTTIQTPEHPSRRNVLPR